MCTLGTTLFPTTSMTDSNAGSHGNLTARMIGAALLRIDTYEEVEHDLNATFQAATVVGIGALCAGVGRYGEGLVAASVFAGVKLLSWLVWAGVTYLVGHHVFKGEATWGELLRTLGFAQAPAVLYLLGVLPLLGGMVGTAVWLWILATSFVAIRQALDIGNGQTALTWLIGFAIYSALSGLLPIPGLAL